MRKLNEVPSDLYDALDNPVVSIFNEQDGVLKDLRLAIYARKRELIFNFSFPEDT